MKELIGERDSQQRANFRRWATIATLSAAGAAFAAPAALGLFDAVSGLDDGNEMGSTSATVATGPPTSAEPAPGPAPVYTATGELYEVPPDGTEPHEASYLRSLLGNMPGRLVAGEATGPNGPDAAAEISLLLPDGAMLQYCVDLGAVTLGSTVSEVACIIQE